MKMMKNKYWVENRFNIEYYIYYNFHSSQFFIRRACLIFKINFYNFTLCWIYRAVTLSTFKNLSFRSETYLRYCTLLLHLDIIYLVKGWGYLTKISYLDTSYDTY